MPSDMDEQAGDRLQGGLPEEVKRANVLSLAFGGRQDRYDQFCAAIEQVVPPGTTVVLRGSAVTGPAGRTARRSMPTVRAPATSTSRSSAPMRCSFST